MIDKKTLSTMIIVAVIIVSMGAVIVYDSTLQDKESSGSVYNLVARVNSEGSGLYINSSVLNERGGTSAFYSVGEDKEYIVTESNKAAWAGLIVATPGAATIQHVQMQSLVEAAGLTFTLYQDGQALDDKHVYYVTNIANKTAVEAEPHIQGGILWEPQFSAIVDDIKNNYVTLGLTNNFFPGHTCCVIAGYSSYMQSHPDETARFLAAYIRGVEWVHDEANHDALVKLCKEKTSGIEEAWIEDALSHITYVHSDDTGDLNKLRKDVADLTKGLAPGLQHTISDLGFTSDQQFSSRFIDDSFIMNAINIVTDPDYKYSGPTYSLKVACISGDIHQIALHVAVEQGYFSEYGLNVTVSAATNGSGVATALQNGEAQFGFMGAPPATSTVINGMLVTY
ncbi:MAG: ABC transporter substrate-binding protein [Candidatus Methanomethylophilaceae archaeon]|nr:ABC transporter substrate-binding protein [Candidatus Methanomethylophilaceae archaeon]MBR6910758.1 ABC transporter substrate-binding protein [Candidatus Methanomethylophilaceae archaeon]